MSSKKRKKMKKRLIDVTPVTPKELEAVRQSELEQTANPKPNIFIGTLNVMAGPMRSLIDPVKKVCYPRLEAHWEEKYRSRFPKHAGKLLVFDLVLLFLASALAVSLVLIHTVLPPILVSESVSVAISQPKTLVSGDQANIVITYSSGSDLLVRDAKLIIESNANLILTDGSGDFTSQRTFDLGDLPPLASGNVDVPGFAYGAPGTALPILVKLSYWEQGRANRTVASAFYKLPIESSPLELEVQFEKPFMTDTVNLIRIAYTNTGDEPLTGARIRFSSPTGFRVTGAIPPLGRSGEWRIGNLAPQASGTISLYGILRSGSAPSFSVSGVAEATDGELRTMNETRLNADAESTGFRLAHDVSGRSLLWPGQETEIVVKYANTGDEPLENMTITLEAEGLYLADDHDFPIIWTPEENDRLVTIAPGESGSLTAKLRLAEFRSQEDLGGATNPSIRIMATGEYGMANAPIRTFRTDSGTSNLPISTAIKIDASALYFTQAGDQLGVGPIPPMLDETTRLWIVITIENGPNALQNVHLTATLLPDARWTNKTSVTSGKPLAFVSSERKIIWNVGDIPAFAGGHLPRATANFEIELKPDKDDLGEVLQLLDHIIIEGEDTFTGARVTAIGETVTAAVRFGPAEAMLGEVIE